METHDIGLGEDIGEGTGRAQPPRRIIVVEERIVGDDLHPETSGELSDALGDGTEANESDRATGDFEPRGCRSRPMASCNVARRQERPAHQGEHGGDHVLGDRVGVGPGRWPDGDAAFGARREVDVVEADTEATDDREPWGRLEQLIVDDRSVPNDEGIGIGHQPAAIPVGRQRDRADRPLGDGWRGRQPTTRP